MGAEFYIYTPVVQNLCLFLCIIYLIWISYMQHSYPFLPLQNTFNIESHKQFQGSIFIPLWCIVYAYCCLQFIQYRSHICNTHIHYPFTEHFQQSPISRCTVLYLYPCGAEGAIHCLIPISPFTELFHNPLCIQKSKLGCYIFVVYI